MKELNELKFQEGLKYSEDHEWVRGGADGLVKIGISDYAQDQLGDIVFVELPEPGSSIAENASFGVVESVKSVSDMLMPLSGEVLEVNAALETAPETVNSDPYDGGWMLLVRPDDPSAIDNLMTLKEYREFLEGGD